MSLKDVIVESVGDEKYDLIPHVEDSVIESAYIVPKLSMHIMPDIAVLLPPSGSCTWDDDGRKNPILVRHAKFPLELRGTEAEFVNTVGRQILEMSDGKTLGIDICDRMERLYGEPNGSKKASICQFLRGSITRTMVTLSSYPVETKIQKSGSDVYYYPVHISIEVTSNCNLRCRHCYGSFEGTRLGMLHADKFIDFAEQLTANGCLSCELTGGECTTHPEFPRIFEWCLRNMNLVAVLTNGFEIPDDIFRLAAEHADRVIVQICVHGNRRYHNMFTGNPGSYDRALSSIERFARGGVLVHSPMILTPDNVDQIQETAKAVWNAGAAGFQVGGIEYSLGRAQRLLEEYKEANKTFCPMELHKKAIGVLTQLKNEHPLFVRFGVSEMESRLKRFTRNCGAGSRSLYLMSNGDLSLCPDLPPLT